MLKIISWNINGIRAVVRKDFVDTLKKMKPDIICLQEIKIHKDKREKEQFDFKNYVEFWNSADRPGYSGTAILVKKNGNKNIKDLSNVNGIGNKIFDDEGRVQTIEFEKFYFVNVYFPHTRHDLSRLDFKLEFNELFLKYVKKLEKKKPVIIGGDMNVAHQEIDLARPKDNEGNPGFVKEERNFMTKFLKAGYIDTYRYLNGDKIQYSWWSQRSGARIRNIGWRIDYFLVSDKLKGKVKKAFIKDKILGSDHCPVGIEIDIK